MHPRVGETCDIKLRSVHVGKDKDKLDTVDLDQIVVESFGPFLTVLPLVECT